MSVMRELLSAVSGQEQIALRLFYTNNLSADAACTRAGVTLEAFTALRRKMRAAFFVKTGRLCA